MSGKVKRCKDCAPDSKRPAPYPGPRCATHHRQNVARMKANNHARSIVARYGITAEQYAALYAFQGGRCAICWRAKGVSKRLAVDHDHNTLKVRGLLCKTCNFDLLGRYDIDALQRAIDYLRRPPARDVL